MVNVNKLKGKMVEKGVTIKELAEYLNLSKSTLYKRLGSDCDKITVKEVDSISTFLGLTLDEVNLIFFTQFVA